MRGPRVGIGWAWIAAALALPAAAVVTAPGCAVRELCFEDRDCASPRVCDSATGACAFECETAADCGFGFACEGYVCTLACGDGPHDCPDGMVSVCGAFCVDQYEASRPDATATSAGVDGSRAVSRADVIPWFSSDASAMNGEVASAACAAAGKRLCTTQEWRVVCRGLDDTDYAYGDRYDPTICNGIDTYCLCDPYPHCYDDCGAELHVMPTGSFPACTNGFGTLDIHGNVWELVDAGDGVDHYRGGAYNCRDSEALHACDYDATWDPSAKGFRCCADGAEGAR